MNRLSRMLLASTLALSLAFGGVPAAPAIAQADELADAQAAVDGAQGSLDAAEERLAAIASEYDGIQQEADDLQSRIDETAAHVLEAQQALIEGRAALGQSAAYEYRSGGSMRSLLTLVFESSSFNDLVRNITYLDAIEQHQSDEVAAQLERSERFDAIVNELNRQKDEQDAKLGELVAKQAEAQQVVSSAAASLQDAQSDQADRVAALQQQADALAATGAATGPVEVEDANTVEREPVVPDTAQPEPDPQPTPDPAPDVDSSWSTGIASAYGGSTDPYTPNPGTTAAGAVCDDNSMGVAVPMAWARYWQYYGRTVEIQYNGMTVFATVNDCGGMGGGSRSLDLQPGVWKAFGYSSCIDWGIRTVKYRFL